MIIAAITRLRNAGFILEVAGDRLRIFGPPLTDAQCSFIDQHKLAIIAALTAEVSQHPVVAAALAEWPDATIAAIRQCHDALLDPTNPDAWA